jgi:hypothetical protein
LLADPYIREIVQEIDEHYIAKWKDPESTTVSREAVWYKSQAFHDLLQELELAVSEGVFARGTLDRHERQAPQ